MGLHCDFLFYAEFNIYFEAFVVIFGLLSAVPSALLSFIHAGWDGMGWDGMGWDGMGWDGMGWDGMGWDGMGWDGMGWDGMDSPGLRRQTLVGGWVL